MAANASSMLESFSQNAPAVRRLIDSVQTSTPALGGLGEGLQSFANGAAEWGQRTRDELQKKGEELGLRRDELLACGRRGLEKMKGGRDRQPLGPPRTNENAKGDRTAALGDAHARDAVVVRLK